MLPWSYLFRHFIGPLVGGAITEFFDFQTSALVSVAIIITFLFCSIDLCPI